MPATPRQTRIAVLVFPAFNILTTMAFVDPFRAANYLIGAPVFSWRFVTAEAGPVTASNGAQLAEATPLAETPAGADDIVIVSSSWTPEVYRDAAVLGWLRRQARLGVTLGGIDTGAFILAYAGLLSGARATVHYEHAAAFRELFPDIDVVDDLYTVERGRVTCCGGAASTDLALAMVHDLHGLSLANAAARYIFHDRLRSAAEPQAPAHFEPVGYSVPATLRRAVVAMERTLDAPLGVGEIADRAGVSQRQLERLFVAHTGVTPVQYYLEVRLDRARGMVTQTDMPMMAIAVACGFASQGHFSKCYRRRFKVAPSVDRRQGRVPFQFRSFPAYGPPPRH
jgi:transcriptional regulator GlxA family with amidase domain